jgi:hypothetical protein
MSISPFFVLADCQVDAPSLGAGVRPRIGKST